MNIENKNLFKTIRAFEICCGYGVKQTPIPSVTKGKILYQLEKVKEDYSWCKTIDSQVEDWRRCAAVNSFKDLASLANLTKDYSFDELKNFLHSTHFHAAQSLFEWYVGFGREVNVGFMLEALAGEVEDVNVQAMIPYTLNHLVRASLMPDAKIEDYSNFESAVRAMVLCYEQSGIDLKFALTIYNNIFSCSH